MKHVFYTRNLVDGLLGGLDGKIPSPTEFDYIVSTDAEDIFRVMNVVTGDPEIELPLTLQCRSMSCGDIYMWKTVLRFSVLRLDGSVLKILSM